MLEDWAIRPGGGGLACVPATSSTQRRQHGSASHSGPSQGMRRDSASTPLPSDITLPTTTMSGPGRAVLRLACTMSMPARPAACSRRIDVLVGACDLVARRARDGRDAAHESATDAKDVNVHAESQVGASAASGGGE